MLCRCKMTAGHSYSLHGPITMLRLFCYVFAHKFLFNPQFDLEPDYIVRKGIRQRIQQCNLHREYCQLFTHESIIEQYAISALYSPPICPFPFDDHHQNLIHPYRAQPHSPPQTASGFSQPCCHCSHVRTDRWDKRKLYPMSAPVIERHANNYLSKISGRESVAQFMKVTVHLNPIFRSSPER